MRPGETWIQPHRIAGNPYFTHGGHLVTVGEVGPDGHEAQCSCGTRFFLAVETDPITTGE